MWSCNGISGVDDYVFDLVPTVQPPGDDEGGGAPVPCTTPTVGMVIESDIVLCAGDYAMPVGSGDAALEVAADDVTVECLDTVVDGAGAVGFEAEEPTVGIRVGAHHGVTIKGCGARGEHEVLARSGTREIFETVEVEEGQTKEITLTFDIGTAPKASSLRVPGYLAFGAAGVGIIVGAVTGALSLDKISELDRQCVEQRCPPGLESLRDAARTLGTVSTASFIIGGVAAATGITLFIVDSTVEASATASSLRLSAAF